MVLRMPGPLRGYERVSGGLSGAPPRKLPARTTLLQLPRLIGEQLAGTPYAAHFATGALE
jgi:hypothetical protein